MWVRFIRALRLAEYSKKAEFKKLATLLDIFYNQKYEVWQGQVNTYKLKSGEEQTFRLLKQRPGLFARSLFSCMLWFGPDVAIAHFKNIIDKVPDRLVYTLNIYAENYFDKKTARIVKPLGGTNKKIPANRMLHFYSDEELKRMRKLVYDLGLEVIRNNFKKTRNTNKTMFIAPELFNIPIAIGDRSEQLQDLQGALTGSRFQVEGQTVRLFMQWGEGLPAQHLDMDLSCMVAYEGYNEHCSYSQLVISGCKHSGDVQHIPNKTGTAEYIDIDLIKLRAGKAKYVSFTCNAYTSGSLAPNLVVGWMDSRLPMHITTRGVAYNPADVSHQIRIGKSLTKALVFGVLDVEAGQVIWLEMAFGGQVVQNLDMYNVEALLKKLNAKTKIGDLLTLKAEVQELTIVSDKEAADEVYDTDWALNTAKVNKLFLS